MSCDTCLKSDCECFCFICEKHEPLNNSTPVKVTRRRKKLHIEWISCNSCNKWVHPKCTDLTKQTKIEQFFKCLKCSLKAAKVAGIKFSLLTESVSIDTSNQTKDCEVLNNTYTEVSQNKSSNTEEVLNNSNITTVNQPAQDLVNNINNFP